jgi:hypothetical protein
LPQKIAPSVAPFNTHGPKIPTHQDATQDEESNDHKHKFESRITHGSWTPSSRNIWRMIFINKFVSKQVQERLVKKGKK